MHHHIAQLTEELQNKAEEERVKDHEEQTCAGEDNPEPVFSNTPHEGNEENHQDSPIENPAPDYQKKVPVPKPRNLKKPSLLAQKKKASLLEIDKTDLEFGDLLGEGGGGSVFRGTWMSKGLPVALKRVRLSPDHCDAKILAELGEHPNIVSFFGYFHEHPDTTIVTALAKNGSLYNYLYKDFHVPTYQKSLRWAKQIAYGMAHLHKLGIAHRDLKSSNILFTDDMEVQICDFGVSRSMPNTTEKSKTAGTWRWMAPEIVSGKKINMMCDVFSFSMVVWELMEHKVPFHREADLVASMRILKGERPQFTNNWPEYLAKLVKVGWSENPYYRPTFADIITSLEHQIYFRH
ncbi:Serine/threonine-protein kinase STY17 [Geodia barretti]|nr:Serine/threonine-protein kinase STY17 [Geodia barretti]